MTESPLHANTADPRTFGEKGLDEYLLDVWKRKWWVLGFTLLFLVAGIVKAAISEPIFESKAVIASKEGQQQGPASMLSQLGGLGGLAAFQLGIGSGHHDHLVIILQSREFLERVIREHGLLPGLFPEKWDAERKRWKDPDSSRWPTPQAGAGRLAKSLKVESVKRKNVIEIRSEAGSPGLARSLVSNSLVTFNGYLRERALVKTRSNMDFLENQSRQAVDPMLQEKIQNLLAMEIEKAMLMHSSGFDVLQEAYLPLGPSRPDRRLIVLGFFLVGLVLSITGAFLGDFLAALRNRKGA